MTSIIGERESKVTQALQTMGMLRSAYWLSWLTWEILLSLVIALIAMAFGAAVQIDFFLKNAFGAAQGHLKCTGLSSSAQGTTS
jgi:uncharacterized membrane protein YhaH (DUF805 family)